jgi:hypothetical protein
MKISALLVSSLLAASATGANAAVVFSDNFNSYAFQLNWVPPSSVWTVPIGTVDLIGETTSGTHFDFFPGNGGYVDLDGTTHHAGTLETAESFGPGAYTLSFDLGGNARGEVAKTTTITLGVGSWSTSLTLASSAPYHLYTYTFTTTGGKLSFGDNTAGNQDIGNILDNVSLSTASGIPEASTWAMLGLGFAGLGFAGFRARRSAVAGPSICRVVRLEGPSSGARLMVSLLADQLGHWPADVAGLTQAAHDRLEV